MSHDFAKSRRPAPPSKKKKSVMVVPSWVWMILGTFAGALVMYLVYVSGYVPPLPAITAVQQAPAAAPEKPTTAKPVKEPPAPPKRTSPVFEFYTKLPASGAPTVDTATLPEGKTPALPAPVAATDLDPIQQLLAQQEAAKQAAGSMPTPVNGLPADASVPDAASAPVSGVAVNTGDVKTGATKATGEQAAVAAKAKPEPAAKPGGRYALQAGAFRKKSEADTLRAKLLLLGVSASIQPVTNAKGESMHRVIAGPFASAADMEDARIILGGNHINTIPVK